MRLAERWLIACIITVTVLLIAKLESNEVIQSDIISFVHTSQDIVKIQSIARQALQKEQEKVAVSSSSYSAQLLKFVNVSALQDGYLLQYEYAPSLEAIRDGFIVFTGYTKHTGKTMTVHYHNNIIVTYGFLDEFQRLPYTSVAQGELLALKETATPLFLKMEKDGQVLELEEMLALFREWDSP